MHSVELDYPKEAGSLTAQRRISALKRKELASSCSLTAPFIQQPGAVSFALLSWFDRSGALNPNTLLFSPNYLTIPTVKQRAGDRDTD